MSVKVTVIMPARNAEKFVRAAVESVVKQDMEGLELLVVDDGSTDRTAEIAQKAGGDRARVVPGPGRGIAAAMNVGVEEAKGELVARCDADDLYVPGRLKRQAGWLERNREFVGVCGGFETIDARGRFICELDCGEGREITSELRSGEAPTHFCTYLVRREAVRGVGGFREYFETSEDIDLQLRLGEYGRVWYDATACYRYRLHDESVTHAGSEGRRTFFEGVARGLQAQRLAGRRDDVDAGCPPLPPEKERNGSSGVGEHVNHMLIGRAWQELVAGRRLRALATGTRACLLHPTQLKNWKHLALLAVKPVGKSLSE